MKKTFEYIFGGDIVCECTVDISPAEPGNNIQEEEITVESVMVVGDQDADIDIEFDDIYIKSKHHGMESLESLIIQEAREQ